MSNKLKRKSNKTESFLTTCYGFFRQAADYTICLYMLLIIVVMPLYHEEGYIHIGTDKHTFFRYCSLSLGGIMLAVLAGYFFCAVFCYIEEERKRRKTQTIARSAMAQLVSQWREKLSVTDIFALLYGLCVILSYLFSDYKDMALWGTIGWYMGLIPQLLFLAVYFCISRLWKKRDWMFYLFLPVSAVVFVLGILNRFGIYPIDMELKDPNFISTIGNINWYCGYMVSVFFAGFYLLWQIKNIENNRRNDKMKWISILLALYVAIGFATLVTQGSMSGFLALGAVLVVLFCLSAGNRSCMEMFWQGILILSGVCFLLMALRRIGNASLTFQDELIDLFTGSIFPFGLCLLSVLFLIVLAVAKKRDAYPQKGFRILAWIVVLGTALGTIGIVIMIAVNTLHPGSLGRLSENDFFTFSTTWGSFRGATWRIGVLCVGEQSLMQRLVGIGPDSMEAFISAADNPQIQEISRECFSGLRLTNAHCEWFTILIDTGIFGFISYAGMIISAIVCFLGQKKGNTLIAGACGICVLAYTVNNVVSFQQTMSAATIYVILGIGRAYCGRLHSK